MPLISIITATYNRSHILRYAIESVLRSTFEDWELLIIGDACTDDTADVVSSYRDSRIRWTNLDANVGEQSGPNNEGLRRAQGKFVAFLNHDDIWLPDHLATGLRVLESTNADVAIAQACSVRPDGTEQLIGSIPDRGFYPIGWWPASTWIHSRELVNRTGYWRYFRECWVAPSQDWLFHAWKSGAHIVSTDTVSLIVIGSGKRKDSYVTKETEAHEKFFRESEDPDGFREHFRARHSIERKQPPPSSSPIDIVKRLTRPGRRMMRQILYRVAILFGIPPQGIKNILKLRRKGLLIDELRATRGLPPVPDR